MMKLLKPYIAVILLSAFAVFSVLCCCTATALTVHLQKKVVTCSHCHEQSGSDTSSKPSKSCLHEILNAAVSDGNSFVIAKTTVDPITTPFHFNKFITTLPPPIILAHPPGSPPLRISLIPLYLHTFSLRI